MLYFSFGQNFACKCKVLLLGFILINTWTFLNAYSYNAEKLKWFVVVYICKIISFIYWLLFLSAT